MRATGATSLRDTWRDRSEEKSANLMEKILVPYAGVTGASFLNTTCTSLHTTVLALRGLCPSPHFLSNLCNSAPVSPSS